MRLEGVDKKPIARVVSRCAARFRLINVLVRNGGCEPFQWHHNGPHEVSQDGPVRASESGGVAPKEGRRFSFLRPFSGFSFLFFFFCFRRKEKYKKSEEKYKKREEKYKKSKYRKTYLAHVAACTRSD